MEHSSNICVRNDLSDDSDNSNISTRPSSKSHCTKDMISKISDYKQWYRPIDPTLYAFLKDYYHSFKRNRMRNKYMPCFFRNSNLFFGRLRWEKLNILYTKFFENPCHLIFNYIC